MIVEVDGDNPKKDIEKMNIMIPILSPRLFREYKNLSELKVEQFKVTPIKIIEFSEEEQREIVFRDITTNEITHSTVLDSEFVPDYRSVVGYFNQAIMKELRLVSGYDILYGKVKLFVQNYLFEITVDLENLNTLRNLSELQAVKTIFETFKKHINELTVVDKGEAEIRDHIKINQCRPFVVKEQGYMVPRKSVFNKIIGDSGFELEFAAFLDDCEDIISFAKNYLAVHFNIEYRNSEGDISNYYPDFIVKKSNEEVYIIETKGLEDVDVAPKIERLVQWCRDVNAAQGDKVYTPLYVKEEDFKKYQPGNFNDMVKNFGII